MATSSTPWLPSHTSPLSLALGSIPGRAAFSSICREAAETWGGVWALSTPPGLRQCFCDEPLGKEVLQPLVHAGDAPVLAVLTGHGLHL